MPSQAILGSLARLSEGITKAMFANRVVKTVQLLDDDGNPAEINIRKLSPRSLFNAAEAKTIQIVQGAQKFGKGTMELFGDSMKESIAAGVAAEKEKTEIDVSPEKKRKARFAGYDRESVLFAGIVSWSMPEQLNPDSIAELDEETQLLLWNEILEITIPHDEDVPKD